MERWIANGTAAEPNGTAAAVANSSGWVGWPWWLHAWNDMNEPSVFDSSELTLPRDSLHFLAALARPLAAADVDAADAAAIASADAAAAALEVRGPRPAL